MTWYLFDGRMIRVVVDLIVRMSENKPYVIHHYYDMCVGLIQL
jgi:hypothetical protein